MGLLDFYDSLHVMPRAIAAMSKAVKELVEVHRPDNGMMAASLELSAYKMLMAELKVVQNEDSLYLDKSEGMQYLEDDSIVGNPDKMLFFAKELAASGEEGGMAQNPYVVAKLDVKSIEEFDFSPY